MLAFYGLAGRLWVGEARRVGRDAVCMHGLFVGVQRLVEYTCVTRGLWNEGGRRAEIWRCGDWTRQGHLE